MSLRPTALEQFQRKRHVSLVRPSLRATSVYACATRWARFTTTKCLHSCFPNVVAGAGRWHSTTHPGIAPSPSLVKPYS